MEHFSESSAAHFCLNKILQWKSAFSHLWFSLIKNKIKWGPFFLLTRISLQIYKKILRIWIYFLNPQQSNISVCTKILQWKSVFPHLWFSLIMCGNLYFSQRVYRYYGKHFYRIKMYRYIAVFTDSGLWWFW